MSTLPSMETVNKTLEGLEGEAFIRKAHELFGDKLAVTSSFGADAMITLSMVAKVDKNIPVLFIDTGKHFSKTMDYVKTLADTFGLTNLQYVRPNSEKLASVDFDGGLWEIDPDTCCDIRKTESLADHKKLHGYKALINGRMHFQTKMAPDTPNVLLDDTTGEFSLSPIMSWTKDRAKEYKSRLLEQGVPEHPLLSQNYRSIGCEPCTDPVIGNPEDERAGRWAGTAKNGGDKKEVCKLNPVDRAQRPKGPDLGSGI